jgi:hypothetical protein
VHFLTCVRKSTCYTHTTKGGYSGHWQLIVGLYLLRCNCTGWSRRLSKLVNLKLVRFTLWPWLKSWVNYWLLLNLELVYCCSVVCLTVKFVTSQQVLYWNDQVDLGFLTFKRSGPFLRSSVLDRSCVQAFWIVPAFKRSGQSPVLSVSWRHLRTVVHFHVGLSLNLGWSLERS